MRKFAYDLSTEQVQTPQNFDPEKMATYIHERDYNFIHKLKNSVSKIWFMLNFCLQYTLACKSTIVVLVLPSILIPLAFHTDNMVILKEIHFIISSKK